MAAKLTTDTAISTLLEQCGCGPVRFAGAHVGLYERHIIFDNIVDIATVDARQRF